MTQLSLNVAHHAGVDSEVIVGTLKVAGKLRVPRDLERGNELRVIVQGVDGEVIATALAEVTKVGFDTIYVKGEPVGAERGHTAKITE